MRIPGTEGKLKKKVLPNSRYQNWAFKGFRLHQISKKQVALNQVAHILHMQKKHTKQTMFQR